MSRRSEAGNWLFSGRRWRDPDIETDRLALEAGYDELVAAFPVLARCSRDRFVGIIAHTCASWTRCMQDTPAPDSPQPSEEPQVHTRHTRQSTADLAPPAWGIEERTAAGALMWKTHVQTEWNAGQARAPFLPDGWQALPPATGWGGAGGVQLAGDRPYIGHGPAGPPSASPAMGSAQFRPAGGGGSESSDSSDIDGSWNCEGPGGGADRAGLGGAWARGWNPAPGEGYAAGGPAAAGSYGAAGGTLSGGGASRGGAGRDGRWSGEDSGDWGEAAWLAFGSGMGWRDEAAAGTPGAAGGGTNVGDAAAGVAMNAGELVELALEDMPVRCAAAPSRARLSASARVCLSPRLVWHCCAA